MSELKVWYEVEISGKKLQPPPYAVQFIRSMGDHTVAEVTAVYPRQIPMRMRPPIPNPSAPVKVTWGTKPNAMREWYGYVHHTRPGYSEELGVETRSYVLVGTGHIMEKQYTKDWRKITDSGIAQQLAEKHGLSLVAHRTKRVYDYLLQPGISDLDWLKVRGKECGRRVHVENGVLYFVEPASLAMARKQQPILERMDKKRLAERVINVEPLFGTLVPTAGKQAKRALTGFDIDQNRLLNAKQVPSEPSPDFVARDTAIAKPSDLYQYVDALGVEHEEWLHATMTLSYDSNVDHLPGQLIDLKGDAVNPKLHGTWMVTKSSHYLQSRLVTGLGDRRFDSELQISRNAADTYQVRDRRVPAVNDACVRSGGKWISASRQVVLL
ncbi:hypothetical protein GCM10010149_89250 [Nonomuraea roseoviolacea subsp. roseoviolacea]|uniref:hypothetical protein n=1 Tax=Nonomuraea roseoviolacea TaxID=103837 RepID=UPI0031D18D2C